MQPDWPAIRSEFPALANWTFLNTATYGQLPRAATEAVAEHFRHRDELACSDFLEWFDDADQVRESIGRLICCSGDDIAFVHNASAGLSLLMDGLEWSTGDRIVTLEGEFPNNLYQSSVETVRWSDFYETINDRTRLVLMSSANFSTGFRPPLEEIGRFLRDRGVLFYVDGTQTVGALPFDVSAVQPDMLVVDAYKWLLSPNGAGFAYVSPQLRQQLAPKVIGWRSHKEWRQVTALHQGAPEFADAAERYEGGMICFPSIYAMGASIDLILAIGIETIEARVMQLTAQCRSLLERLGATILYPNSHILVARFPGVDAADLVPALKARGILVSARYGCLRVSAHFYNDENDVARLGDALSELLQVSSKSL